MEITPQELLRRGYHLLPGIFNDNVQGAYQSPDRRLILYLISDGFWYLQTFFDYPSMRWDPFLTFEQLDELLRSLGYRF